MRCVRTTMRGLLLLAAATLWPAPAAAQSAIGGRVGDDTLKSQPGSGVQAPQ